MLGCRKVRNCPTRVAALTLAKYEWGDDSGLENSCQEPSPNASGKHFSGKVNSLLESGEGGGQVISENYEPMFCSVSKKASNKISFSSAAISRGKRGSKIRTLAKPEDYVIRHFSKSWCRHTDSSPKRMSTTWIVQFPRETSVPAQSGSISNGL